jgi:hypothetical protein
MKTQTELWKSRQVYLRAEIDYYNTSHSEAVRCNYEYSLPVTVKPDSEEQSALSDCAHSTRKRPARCP